MSEKIVQLNEDVIKGQLKELVRGSVEETLNELLEKEAEQLTQAARYERSEARQGYCIFRSMKSTCTGKQVHSLGETGPLSRRRGPLLKEDVPLPSQRFVCVKSRGKPIRISTRRP